MRQKLPETAGYPLDVNDISRTIHPGEEFDAPHLVPGCVPVKDTKSKSDGDAAPGQAADGKAAAKKEQRP